MISIWQMDSEHGVFEGVCAKDRGAVSVFAVNIAVRIARVFLIYRRQNAFAIYQFSRTLP